MKYFGYYWQFPFNNLRIVEEALNNEKLKIMFLVEGTFVKKKSGEPMEDSPLLTNYGFQLNYDQLKEFDIIITYNEIDVKHFQALPNDHPCKKKFVYVPYIPKITHLITSTDRDIDILTMFTNESLQRNNRRINFFKQLQGLKHININGLSTENQVAPYFKRSKIIVHVYQTDFHRNVSELTLLPALVYGIIPISEYAAITEFSYSQFIIWTDTIVDTIKNVLNNYDYYFNKIIQNKDLPQVLINMEKKAINQLHDILNCEATHSNPHEL